MAAMPKAVREQAERANKIAEELKQRNDPSASANEDEVRGEQVDSGSGDESHQMREAEPQPTPQEDWEKRFKNYKSSTDQTIAALRGEIGKLSSDNQALKDEILSRQKAESQESAQTDLYAVISEAIPEDDREFIGDEAMRAIAISVQKAMESAVGKQIDSLRGEVTKLTQDRDKSKLQSQQAQYGKAMEARMDTLAESGAAPKDWRKFDADPAFGDWMKDNDEILQVPRHQLYVNAYRSGDVVRMASFYSDWAKLRGVNRSPDGRFVPKSTGTGTPEVRSGQGGRTWTNGEIHQFYNEKRQGRYTKEQAEKIESEIREAIAQSRVVR